MYICMYVHIYNYIQYYTYNYYIIIMRALHVFVYYVSPVCIYIYIYTSDMRCVHDILSSIYVTRHEKTGLMYTKYTCSHYCKYISSLLHKLFTIGKLHDIL